MRLEGLKNKIGYRVMALVMICTVIGISYSNIFADSISDMNGQLGNIKSQLEANKGKLQGIEAEINNIKLEMVNLDIEIAKYNTEISKMESQMEEVDKELAEKEEKLSQASQQQDGAQKLLQTRLRAMYENGFVDFWDILFSSGSFTDFISRYSVVSTILEYDKTMVDNLKNQKEYSENLKKDIEIKKVQQEQLKYDRQKTADLLKTKQSNRQIYMNQLESNQTYIAQINKDLQAKERQLVAKIEEETAKLTEGSSPTEPNAKGFIWPFPNCKYISCHFGGYNGHSGTDIAPPSGEYNANPSKFYAVAAKGGKVVKVATGYGNTYPYSYIYGNYVQIDHENGQSTIYGHLKSVDVKVGQRVTVGQKIGIVGNTGYSTGTHLHFELMIYQNGKYKSVDAEKYLY